MPFQTERFRQADITPRTKVLPVPALRDFFDAGEEPVWTVRGLSGVELAQMREAASNNRDLGELARQFMGGDAAAVAAAIKERFGIGDSVPDEVARHLAVLRMGSVVPEIDQEIAIRINEAFPAVFQVLVQAILELSAEGSVVGKLPGSTETAESG